MCAVSVVHSTGLLPCVFAGPNVGPPMQVQYDSKVTGPRDVVELLQSLGIATQSVRTDGDLMERRAELATQRESGTDGSRSSPPF